MRNNFDAQKHCDFPHKVVTIRTLVLLYLKFIVSNILSFIFSIICFFFDCFMGSNLEKKQRNNLQKKYKNKAKRFKSDNIYKISDTRRKENENIAYNKYILRNQITIVKHYLISIFQILKEFTKYYKD